MIRHTVLIACDGAATDAVDRIVDELRALPPLIPEIKGYTVGRNLGLDGSTADVAVIADFASVEDYAIYSAHPEHVRVVTDFVKPVATGLTRAQFELD
ncbi:MAG: Dabb family protein [Acidimicrobiales bacterium]|nr:Dabb family protein [Acidimicrobiales bacterium]